MNRVLFTILFFLVNLFSWGQDVSFGKITITPYIPEGTKLDATAKNLMMMKLSQVVNTNDVVGGFDQRFIIVPFINILSETETATIPQKTSLKIGITFSVGDGIAGTLFKYCYTEISGVGDSHADAIYSAIRKIDVKSAQFHDMIAEAKGRIVNYYNTVSPTLIKEAEGFMSSQDYERALARLSVIPSLCSSYDRANTLISECGSKIIERDNNSLLTNAKAAWGANPNELGASEASSYLSQIVISSTYYKNEVEKLTKQMSQRLTQLENSRIELEKVKVLSEERLATERINASARTTSAFFNSLPKLVFNILRWF